MQMKLNPPTKNEPLNLDSIASKRDSSQPVCARYSQSFQVEPGMLWRYGPMNCRSLQCERCGPKVAAQRAREIEAAAREHDLKWFITLTLGQVHELSQAELLRRLRSTWAKLRVYLHRKYKKSIAFVAVVETTVNLIPHLHVLVDRHIDEQWLAGSWTALGGGPFVKVKGVGDLRGRCRYLVKQLPASSHSGFPLRTRRVTSSRGIRLSSYRSKQKPRVIFQPIQEIKARAGNSVVEDIGDSFLSFRGDLR